MSDQGVSKKSSEIIRNILLPLNTRFYSIIDADETGLLRWKKVEIRVEDHVVVPTFPIGLLKAEYEEHLREYLSKIAGERLLEGRPLWEVHVIKYPTLSGAASLVFKFSHAIGDGYSIVGLLFQVFQRADEPSLPLTFPPMSLRYNEGMGNFWGFLSMLKNTFSDFTWRLLKGTFLEDSKSAIRSGKNGVEFQQIDISSFTISLERVKQVKSKVGGTVNDVIVGLIYYAIHLYTLRMRRISSGRRMTLLVTFNTRMLMGYENIDEMVKANIWGNRVSFLPISIPSYTEIDQVHPLHFIIKAKENIERKKKSMYVYLKEMASIAGRCIGGKMGMAQFVHKSIKNASATLSNVVGPKEKMALGNYPISSFYFMMSGLPQSLIFTVVSYMGQLKLVTVMEKGFINSPIFTSCMNEAFEAACGKDLNVSN